MNTNDKQEQETVTLTSAQIGDLIIGLYNLGCRILQERAPRMTVEMVRAVFERRLASEQPKAMAALTRFPMRKPRGAKQQREVGS
jgi:hypothetical protein